MYVSFETLKKAYQQLWQTNPKDIDIAGQNHFEFLYASIMQTEEFSNLFNIPVTVVDMGAGRGSGLVTCLADFATEVIAIDAVPQKTRYLATNVLEEDILAVSLKNEVADVTVSAYVMVGNNYFKSEGTRRTYIAELLRITKPGGLIWIEEPSLQYELFRDMLHGHEYSFLGEHGVHFVKKCVLVPA